MKHIAARALATYLIPGCVGRGVRLGSESSSGGAGDGAGGVWKSGNLEIWAFGDLGTWKSRNLLSTNSKKQKFSKFKSVLPKMSARSGSVGKKSSWPYLRPSQAIFSMDQKNQKDDNTIAYFPWWANGPYSPGLGPCCYPPEVGQ